MMGKRRIYLDTASAAPVTGRAWRTFLHAHSVYGNPSAPHAEGRVAATMLADARLRIARLAGTKPEAVIFTSGATEANNLAISGTVMKRKQGGGAHHVLYAPGAHASIVEPMRMLESYGVAVEEIPLAAGTPRYGALKKCIRPETILVVLEAVSGETGVRYDTREVRRILDSVRPGIQLHVDGSQLPRAGAFELIRLGADMLTLDAQKVGGVRGIGALIVRVPSALAPLMHGGGQEQGLRPGTESPALATAFAAALEESSESRDKFLIRAHAQRQVLITGLSHALPDMVVNEGAEQAPYILNVSFPGRDTDYAAALMDEAGIAVSTKSACESDEEGSRAVLALTGDTARAAATLRISWGPEATSSELKRAGKELIRIMRFLDLSAL